MLVQAAIREPRILVLWLEAGWSLQVSAALGLLFVYTSNLCTAVNALFLCRKDRETAEIMDGTTVGKPEVKLSASSAGRLVSFDRR